jgi:nucleotide-binding universal stress UspA family protein
MSDIRSILLHLDATPGSAARLALARALADRHGARVTALFGVRPDPSQTSFAYSAGAALQAAEAQGAPLDSERARLQDLLAAGERECLWCDVVGDSVVHGFVAEAAYADLLVIGAPSGADDGGPPAGFVQSVILQSGTPAIVVPAAQLPGTLGERVLVAWDGSVPAARALKAALPLLQRAAAVEVVSCARQAPAAPFSGIGPATWLQRHGVEATMHVHPAQPDVADQLRAIAERSGADLLVMGCYGHSRFREQVFGGVTRGLLARLPVPVLMAH